MKENKYFSQQKRKISHYYTEYDNNIIKEEDINDTKILDKSIKIKKQNNSKTQIFPLVNVNNNGSKKIEEKNVIEKPNINKFKSSPKNLILVLKENHELKNKKEEEINTILKTEIPFDLDKNNDSSIF